MMTPLEERIGYQFKDPRLLKQALSHPSVAYESRKKVPDYQRLEFLGDTVVELVVSEALYRMFPANDEGLLTKLRTRAVQTGTMARIARQLDLGTHVMLGRGEEQNGGRDRDSTLADALESVVGAVYLDGGIAHAHPLVMRLWAGELDTLKRAPVELNPKGQLQELLQLGEGGETPSYRIVATEGPDHAKSFQAVVVWKGHELASGLGRSKKEAQTAAAQQTLLLPNLDKLIAEERRKATPL